VDEGICIDAMRIFMISNLLLWDHVYSVTHGRLKGGKTFSTSEEEVDVVDWITKLQELGHSIILTNLTSKVVEVVNAARLMEYTVEAMLNGGKRGIPNFSCTWIGD
jgi:hypothetical protein